MKPSLLIVGLGNPGAQYAETRHNLGWQAVEALAGEFATGEWQTKQKFTAQLLEARIVTLPVLLVKPQTYMNRSGEAIQKLLDFYKLKPAENLIVICDDVDLPLGEVRWRMKGGPGTHNGLKSIVQVIGEEFVRVRIGLGQPLKTIDLSAWVLSKPSSDEIEVLQKSLTELPTAVREFVVNGTETNDSEAETT